MATSRIALLCLISACVGARQATNAWFGTTFGTRDGTSQIQLINARQMASGWFGISLGGRYGHF